MKMVTMSLNMNENINEHFFFCGISFSFLVTFILKSKSFFIQTHNDEKENGFCHYVHTMPCIENQFFECFSNKLFAGTTEYEFLELSRILTKFLRTELENVNENLNF